MNVINRREIQNAYQKFGCRRFAVDCREELAKIWERSNLNTEQLLAHLQAWCAKAESSGVEALVAMSRRIRSYA